MSDTIVWTGTAAERRLQELGLDIAQVDEAIRAGVNARRSNNDFEPRSAPGLKDWIARVGELRRRVVAEANWRYADPRNVPLVYEAHKSRALGVLLGDQNTGDARSKTGPRSKYPKGAVIAEATAQGTGQPTLDLDLTQSSNRGHLDIEDLAAMDVWFLVTHPLDVGDEFMVRREVSLADPISPDSHITSWKQRLVFPPLRFAPIVMPGGPEAPDEIDVYVRALQPGAGLG